MNAKTNTYEIEGRAYRATSEYEAVKEAYKMANRIELAGYLGGETWQYNAIFSSGNACVTVRTI